MKKIPVKVISVSPGVARWFIRIASYFSQSQAKNISSFLWLGFTKRLKILKPHIAFKRCRRKLVVNTYKGCAWGSALKSRDTTACLYCYSISYMRITHIYNPKPRKDFKRRLDEDIAKYLRSGFPKYPVYVCAACDPFQPLENIYGYTLYALRRLGEAGFPIILLTKNPSMLLKPDYLEEIDKTMTVIEVTIPFLNGRFEPYAPTPSERIEAVEKLIKLGFMVYVRLDPVVPIYGKVRGQSKEEIETLIKELADLGVKRIISKCLTLAIPVKEFQSKPHLEFYNALEPLYKVNGFKFENFNMRGLKMDARRKLLVHVYEACTKHGISLSTCSDPAFFKGSSSCDRVIEDLNLRL